MKKVAWAAGICVSLSLAMAACGGSDTNGSKGSDDLPSGVVAGEEIASADLVKRACDEGTVVYYSSQSADDEDAIIKSFREHFRCIDVQVVALTSSEAYARITTEARAKKVQADAGLLADPSLLGQAIDQDVLQGWTPPSDKAYPAEAKKAPYWYGASGAITYFAYNNKVVDEADAPKTWADLLDPKWKGKISTSGPTGGPAWTGWWAVKNLTNDPDAFTKLKALKPSVQTSFSQVVTGLARGEYEVAVSCNLCDYHARTAEGAPITPVYAPEGVGYTPYGMYLLKDAPHPAAGELFANWYLSKQGQEALVAQRGAVSARDDVAAPKGVPSVADLKVFSPVLEATPDQYESLVKDYNSVFGG